MPQHHALPVRPALDAPLTLAQSEAHVELDDPASAVFTDLRIASSVVVPIDEALEDARRLMQHAGVRMAFVLDGGGVTGLVTAADLQGERALQASTRRGMPHGELGVADVMTPVAHWAAIDVSHLARARVGDIVATFRATVQRYLIVVEGGGGASCAVIRGVFSANRVERALGRTIEEELRTNSFSALAAALAGS